MTPSWRRFRKPTGLKSCRCWRSTKSYVGRAGVDAIAIRTKRHLRRRNVSQMKRWRWSQKFTDEARNTVPSVYSAHVTRGLIALRDGDRRLAVAHMREATDALARGRSCSTGGPRWDRTVCATTCSTAGERESVAEFYERSAKFSGRSGPALVKSATAIRAGLMPEGYQYSSRRTRRIVVSGSTVGRAFRPDILPALKRHVKPYGTGPAP